MEYCSKCQNRGRSPVPGRKLCIDCLIEARKLQARKRLRYKQEGRCHCGRPVINGYHQCKICRDKFLKRLPSFIGHPPVNGQGAKIIQYRTSHPACEICGFSEVIEVHHRDNNRANNSFDNFISLCPNHHTMLHKNLIAI